METVRWRSPTRVRKGGAEKGCGEERVERTGVEETCFRGHTHHTLPHIKRTCYTPNTHTCTHTIHTHVTPTHIHIPHTPTVCTYFPMLLHTYTQTDRQAHTHRQTHKHTHTYTHTPTSACRSSCFTVALKLLLVRALGHRLT